MIDMTSGPNAPVSKAFHMAGLETYVIGIIFGDHHDLSSRGTQQHIRSLLPKSGVHLSNSQGSTKSKDGLPPQLH